MFKRTNKKGFSLIELIVVVAIMAILVALLAPNVLKYIEKSKFGKDINSLDSVRLAIEAEIMDEKLSSYETEGWVKLSQLTAEGASENEELLGKRLFGPTDAKVLNDDFKTGKVFTSKTAATAEIYFNINDGVIAVAGFVTPGTFIEYNGEKLFVSATADAEDFKVTSTAPQAPQTPSV